MKKMKKTKRTKKIIAVLLALFLLTIPVLAGWQPEPNRQSGITYNVDKCKTAPVIGQFDTGKYTKLDIKPGDVSYFWLEYYDNNTDIIESWAKNLKFEAYVTYDDNNLYTLIISGADNYYNNCDDGDYSAWQYSCIQVSLASADDKGGERLEFGIWRNSENGKLGSCVWGTKSDMTAYFEPKAGSDYSVALKDGKLYYETAVPINTFINLNNLAENSVKSLNKIGWNIVICQGFRNLGYPGYIHTQISSGCTGENGKYADQFAKLTLNTPVVIPPPAEKPVYGSIVDLINKDIKITADKTLIPPVIDGRLDVNKYKKINTSPGDFLYYGEYMNFLKTVDLDAYIAYDARNLYVLLSGDANKYYYNDHTKDNASDLWNQSSMQISVAAPYAEYGERLEMGLARNSRTGENLSYIWSQGSDSYGKDEYEIIFGQNGQNGQNCAILLESGRLNYEVAIPWTAFLPEVPKTGDTFGFNFLYGWSDKGTRIFREYSAGCAMIKAADLFAKVTLTDSTKQSPYKVGDVIGNVLNSDIKTYINGQRIPCYNINGRAVVLLTDLRNYGFDVNYDSMTRTSAITRNIWKKFTPIENIQNNTAKPGTVAFSYLYTDIIAISNEKLVESFNVQGNLAIFFDSLGDYGTFKWDSATRSSKLTLY